MYSEDQIQNYLGSLPFHQKYFILRWGEILDHGEIRYWKLLQPCSRAILKEVVEVIKLYRKKILHEYNIDTIIKEASVTVKRDIILQTYFPKDWSYFLDQLDKYQLNQGQASLELIITLSQTLFNKLESKDIIVRYSRFLMDRLAVERITFQTVDDYLSLLISELLYEGYSSAYLYKWGAGVFLYDEEEDFINRVKRIAELGSKNIRRFECLFHLNLPSLSDNSLFSSDKGQIRFFEKADKERIRLGEDYGIEDVYHKPDFREFFDETKPIARVSIDVVDGYAAASRSRNKLESTVKLLRLAKGKELYNPGISQDVLVHDTKGKRASIIKIDHQSHGFQLAKLNDIMDILLNSQPTNSYRGLDRLLQWCRVVQDSPRETGLMAIWSMMEFLFVPQFDKKLNNVLNYARPFIAHYYTKNMMVRISSILMKDTHRYNELKMEITREYSDSLTHNGQVKLHFLLQFISEHLETALAVYEGKTLEQRYICLGGKFTKIRKDGKRRYIWLLKFINDIENQVLSDLQRAYRIRNILAHEAVAPEEFFEEIYDKMIFYIRIILDDLLHSMSLQPLNTIQQLVQIKKESYLNYNKMLVGFSTQDTIQYREIVNTKNLFI